MGAAASAPISIKIPPQQGSRVPSNIPLRTLPSRTSSDNNAASASLLPTNHHHGNSARRSSFGSESSWTDTGDIGEQLDEDDPVRLQLPDTVEDELLAGVSGRQRRQKKVRIYEPSPKRYDRSSSRPRTIDKEAIQIPNVRPPRPSVGQRFVGFIMAGPSGAIHGLTGKALLYVTRCLALWLSAS